MLNPRAELIRCVMFMFKILLTVILAVVVIPGVDKANSILSERQQQEFASKEFHSNKNNGNAGYAECQLSGGSFRHQRRVPESKPSVTVPKYYGEEPTERDKSINGSQQKISKSSSSMCSVRPKDHYIRNLNAGPALIDWRKSSTYPRVRDQNEFGRCGACWAFSPVSVLEILYSKWHQTRTHFSYQQLIDCCPGTNGCKGGQSVKALQYLVDVGVPLEKDYPYKGVKETCQLDSQIIGKAKTFEKVENDEEAMVQALRRSPLVVALNTVKEMHTYIGGVINPASCRNETKACTHSTVIVGHGEDYWIIRNTWGENFGDAGHYLLKKGTCGVGHKVWSATLDRSIRNPRDVVEMTKSYLYGITGISKIFGFLKKYGICS